jgi:hypothetical protein
MAETWTSPTDDIIIQEGTFAFDFDASGTVYGGQAVYCNKDMAVAALPVGTATTAGCVGIAAYKQTTGKPVAVFGPGNICRAIVSGASIRTGDTLIIGALGKLDLPSTLGGNAAIYSGVRFIALENKDAADSTIKVMIY